MRSKEPNKTNADTEDGALSEGEAQAGGYRTAMGTALRRGAQRGGQAASPQLRVGRRGQLGACGPGGGPLCGVRVSNRWALHLTGTQNNTVCEL